MSILVIGALGKFIRLNAMPVVHLMIAAIYASVNDQSSLMEFFVYGVYLCGIQDGVLCLQ
jgi:hypothetical protein